MPVQVYFFVAFLLLHPHDTLEFLSLGSIVMTNPPHGPTFERSLDESFAPSDLTKEEPEDGQYTD